MLRIGLLATLFFACTAWADEPDFSQFKTRIPETASRLAHTEEQQAQVRAILEDHFDAQMAILEKYGTGNRDGGKQPDFQTMRALRNELEANRTDVTKRLSGILSKEQMAEFEQIQAEHKQQIRDTVQSKLIEGIGTKLALTGTQMARVKPILEGHFNAQMAILDKHGIKIGNQGDGTRPGFRTLRALRNEMNALRAATRKQLSGILSEAQMAEFETMQAEQKERMRAYFLSRS